MQSLVDNIMCVGAGIVTLQETHFKKKGSCKESWTVMKSLKQ